MAGGRRWRCRRKQSRPVGQGQLQQAMAIDKAESTCVPPSPGIGPLVLYHKLLCGPAIGFWSWSCSWSGWAVASAAQAKKQSESSNMVGNEWIEMVGIEQVYPGKEEKDVANTKEDSFSGRLGAARNWKWKGGHGAVGALSHRVKYPVRVPTNTRG